MDGIFNLEKWVRNALKNVKKNGINQDIHIDRILINYKNLSIKEKLFYSFTIFNDIVNKLSDFNTDGIGIYLNVDLIGRKTI